MARFLITTWHPPGHVYPQVAVANALRARGHEVAFYSAPQTAKVLEIEGYRLFPFKHVNEEHVDRVLFGSDRDSAEPSGGLSFARLLRDWMLETIPDQMADLNEILAEFRPDVVTSDQTMWGPVLILAEQGRVPVAITSCGACCMIPGPDAPPFGLGLPKPKTFGTRLLAGAVTVGQRLITVTFRRRLNELRRQYGLPPMAATALEQLGNVPLYIIPSTPEFDFNRHDLPASVRYVGPYLWNKPATIVSPDWLLNLPHTRPWIHATEGTVHVGEPLVLRATAQGLAGLDMEVIMTSGGARDPESIDLGAKAANLHLARWIAHSDLLPKTDVIITTGGAGTVLASIAARVPMILVPTEWDKPEIAQRIVEAGAGIRIMPKKLTPRSVRAAVERILGDRAYKTGVTKLAEASERYGGADAAAELLEGLIQPSAA